MSYHIFLSHTYTNMPWMLVSYWISNVMLKRSLYSHSITHSITHSLTVTHSSGVLMYSLSPNRMLSILFWHLKPLFHFSVIHLELLTFASSLLFSSLSDACWSSVNNIHLMVSASLTKGFAVQFWSATRIVITSEQGDFIDEFQTRKYELVFEWCGNCFLVFNSISSWAYYVLAT